MTLLETVSAPYAFGIPDEQRELRTSPYDPYIREVISRAVADHQRVPFDKLFIKSRKREYVQCRQISMYLLWKHSKLTLKEIGEYFGGRDHSTAIHGKDVIVDELGYDVGLRMIIKNIEEMI